MLTAFALLSVALARSVRRLLRSTIVTRTGPDGRPMTVSISQSPQRVRFSISGGRVLIQRWPGMRPRRSRGESRFR